MSEVCYPLEVAQAFGKIISAARDVADAGRTEIEDGAVLHALAGALQDLDSLNSWRSSGVAPR